MDVTQVLLNNDKSLKLVKESDFSGAGNAVEYTAFNSGGVEVEVGEYLYSMIRLLKPDKVLETGAHYGISASYMASALRENNKGHLTTTEFLNENYLITVERLKALGLNQWATVINDDTKTLYGDKETRYGFIFLDTEPETRFEELCQFYDNLEEGGYLVIHDLPRDLCQGNVNTDHPEIKSWPFGDIPAKMRQLVREDKLRPMHFPNPRSMMGFYKTKREDLKW